MTRRSSHPRSIHLPTSHYSSSSLNQISFPSRLTIIPVSTDPVSTEDRFHKHNMSPKPTYASTPRRNSIRPAHIRIKDVEIRIRGHGMRVSRGSFGLDVLTVSTSNNNLNIHEEQIVRTKNKSKAQLQIWHRHTRTNSFFVSY